jgi:hypothetical protein
MALYLCREVKRHLEELDEEHEGKEPGKNTIAQDLEGHLGMKLKQMITDLKGLEKSIEAQDVASMLGFEDLIDALVDYLDHLIDATGRSAEAGPRGVRMHRHKAFKESAGKLAQLLCQID